MQRAICDRAEEDFVLALMDAVILEKSHAVAEIAAWFECSWIQDPLRRAIATGVFKLASEGKPVSPSTLARTMVAARKNDPLAGVSPTRLGSFIQDHYGWCYIRTYAGAIYEAHKRRTATECALDAVDRLAGVEESDGVVRDLMGIGDQLQRRIDRNQDNKQVFQDMIAEIDGSQAQDVRGQFGIGCLDFLFSGGLYPGQLVVVGARVGAGKSSLLGQIALSSVVKLGVGCCMFSLEMSAKELYSRWTMNHAGKSHQQDRRAYLDSMAAIERLVNKDHRLHVFTGGRDIEVIEAEARAYVNQHQASIIMVDYIQLVNSKTSERTEERIADVTRRLKLLSQDLQVPVVAAAQINRAGQDNPTLADFRGSGAIEQDADIAIILHPKRELDHGCILECRVAKHRNGRAGIFDLMWIKQHHRFHEMKKD